MSKCMLATTLSLLVTAAVAQMNATTADKPRKPNPQRVLAQELQLRGIVQAMFATLIREADLSGGVAVSNQDCSHGAEGSISVPAGTSFDKALGLFAKSGVISEGQLRDGVADLLPAGGAPPLLQVRIPRFEWDRNAPVSGVIDRLRQLPEVSEEALKLGLKEAPIEGGMSAICIRGDCSEKPKPATVLETEEGATLLTMLNRIVRAHSGAVWSYSEYHCDKGRLFSLEILSE